VTEPTSLSLTPDRYIAERVHAYQTWYDKKAVQAKARYLRMRAFAVIGGGLVPVLINITPDVQVGRVFVLRSIVTTISLLVVIGVSLESVFHYREQWKNYRSTEQLLGHETFRFRTRIGPYAGQSIDQAFLIFVERVEDAIAAENMATLSVMTLAAEASDDSQKRRGGKTI
jgi:hypothetical protein